MRYINVSTIQIIFNISRQKPVKELLEEAKGNNVGIIVRVPLASGLLIGNYHRATEFGKYDHRFFNRNGASFDKGETFSRVDYKNGLLAREEVKKLFPQYNNLAPLALRSILMHPEVSCVIPGLSRMEQLHSNFSYDAIPALSESEMNHLRHVYDKHTKESVHHLW